MNSRKDFEKYINRVFNPSAEIASYEERVGAPDELPAVIGLIALNFSELESVLSDTIIKMLQLDERRGNIMTAELSFKVKLNVFSCLYQNLKSQFSFNAFPDFEDEYFGELVKALNKCEELRNQTMHSTFARDYLTKSKIVRRKTTAKQKGLKKVSEETTIVKLFNIADFIGSVTFELDQFGIDIMKPKNNPIN